MSEFQVQIGKNGHETPITLKITIKSSKSFIRLTKTTKNPDLTKTINTIKRLH